MNLEVSVVIPWNLSLGTPLLNGHLHSKDTTFGPGKKFPYILYLLPLLKGYTFSGSQRIPQHLKRDWPQRGLISLSVH